MSKLVNILIDAHNGDAVPPLTEAQTAEFRALMVELDKRDHDRRAAEYEALTDGDYDAWLDAQDEADGDTDARDQAQQSVA